MTTSSIDIDGMVALINRLESTSHRLHTVQLSLRSEADRAGVSTVALTRIEQVARWIDDELPGLRRRLNLAIAADAQRSQSLRGTRVRIKEPTMTSAQAQALGVDLAGRLRDLDPGLRTPGREDVERFEEVVRLLEEHAGDPDVMSGLIGELGPQGVVDLPIALQRLADSYDLGLGQMDTRDLMWDENTHMTTRIADLQQQFVEAFGAGLATATWSPTFRRDNPDFADGLVEVATQAQDGRGWGLSQVLRYGTFEAGFLVDVGEGLYAWEREHPDITWWAQGSGGQVQNWRLGADDQGQYYDPAAGLFEAMTRNPIAATDFFNPADGAGRAEGAEVVDRVGHFVGDRLTSDDFASLAGALDAAAGHFHTTTASTADQTRSAWVASATVQAFAQRGGTTPGAADAMAQLLGRYIVDVDRVANGDADGTVGVYDQAPDPWHVGLPVGADMSWADLRVVLKGVLADPGAAEVLGAKAALWNAYRLNWAADHSTPGDPVGLQTAVENGAELNGFLLGVAGADLEARAAGSDAGVKSLLSALGALRGLVRTNPATAVTLGVVLSEGQAAATQAWATSEQDVAASNIIVRDAAELDYQIGVLRVLEDHGLVDAETIRWGDGSVPSFMTSDGVSEHAETVPQMRRDLRQWLDTVQSEGLPREMRDEAAAGYKDGDEWARRRD